MLFEVFKLVLAEVVSVRDSTYSLVEIYVTAESKSLSGPWNKIYSYSFFPWCPTVCSWCMILRLLLQLCVF